MVAELLSQQLVRASRSFFREATLGTTRNHGGKMETHPAPAGLNSRLAMQPSWGHGQSHLFGDLVRNPSLASPINNLGNLDNSLGGENRQASWVSPSPKDQGGDPALRSLGSKSASSWHIALLAMEECMTKEPELTATTHMFTSLEPDGHLVMLLDSFNQEALKALSLEKVWWTMIM